jgi:hypothetical protein
MTPEDRLRAALSDDGSGSPPPEAWDAIQHRIRHRRPRPSWWRRWPAAVIALVALAGTGAGVGVALAPAGHGNRVQVVSPTTVATTPPTGVTATTNAGPPTTVAGPPVISPPVISPPGTTPASPPTTVTGIPLSEVDWAAVVAPQLDCGSYPTGGEVPVTVVQVSDVQPAGAGPEALVLARCNPGAGDPPDGLYAFRDAISRTTATLAQILMATGRQTQETGFTVNGSTISMSVSGYSSPSVPQCCANVHYSATWAWTAGRFVGHPPGATGPVPLDVTVTANPPSAAVGQTVTYLIAVTNTGTEAVTDAQLYLVPTASGDQPSTCTTSQACSLGTLAPGATVHRTVTVKVTARPDGASAAVYGVLPSGTIGATAAVQLG